MKFKKSLCILLSFLFLSPACSISAGSTSALLEYSNFEEYGTELGTPWSCAGTYSPAPTEEVGKGKSAKLVATAAKVGEIIRTFSASADNVVGSVIGFSVYAEDFDCNRNILIRQNGKTDDIPVIQINTSGKINIGGVFSGIQLSVQKWYDVMIEHSFVDGFVRVSVYDGESTVIGEGVLEETYRNLSRINRMQFVAWRPSVGEAVAYVDNVYMYGIDFAPSAYGDEQLPEKFEDYVASSDGLTPPGGWDFWNSESGNNTIGSEYFDNIKYANTLKMCTTGKGSKSPTVLKFFTAVSGKVSVEFDFRRTDASGVYIGRRGYTASGSNVNDEFMIQIAANGNIKIGGVGDRGTLAYDKWYHFKIDFDYSNTVYNVTVTDGESTFVGTGEISDGTVSLRCIQFYYPKSQGSSVCHIDNFIVKTQQKFALAEFSPSFGKIPIDTECVYAICNDALSSDALDNAVITLNDDASSVMASIDGNSKIKIDFVSSLQYDTQYVLNIENIKSADGSVFNAMCIYHTPARYEIKDFKILTDNPALNKITASANLVSNDAEINHAVLVAAIYNAETGEMISAGIDETSLSPSVSSLTHILSSPSDGGKYEVGAYLWNSVQNMQSLTSSKSVALYDGEISHVTGDIPAQGVKYDFDDENFVLTISGRTLSASEERVTVALISPGFGENDLTAITSKNFSEVFANIKEVTSNSFGAFAVPAFKVNGQSGYYSIAINGTSGKIAYIPNAFLYISPVLETELIEAVNDSSKTSAEIATLLSTNAAAIDLEYFSSLNESLRTKAVSIMNKSCSSLDELKSNLGCAVFAALVDDSKDVSSAVNLVDTYSEYLTQSIPFYSIYESFTQEQKLSLAKKLVDTAPYPSANETLRLMGDSIILSAVSNITVHSQVENILALAKSWIKTDLSAYFSLQDKKSTNMAVMNKTYSSVEQLCSAVLTAVADACTLQSASGNKGASSVSASGSSQKVTVGSTTSAAAVITPIETTSVPNFYDLQGYDWAEIAIEYLQSANIINGIGEMQFAPAQNVTREQFAKMLVEAIAKIDTSASSPFDDCPDSHWSYPYVSTAYSLGIVRGLSDSWFGVGEFITRQDMALMLYRALEKSEIILTAEKNAVFSDSDAIAPYAYDAVINLANSGIINGTGDGRFSPIGNATRAEAAKIIYEVVVRKAE